jgi:hypothetical protein
MEKKMNNKTNWLKTLPFLQNPQSEDRGQLEDTHLSRRSVLQILGGLCLSFTPLGCSKVPEVPDFIKDTFQPEMIVPVFDPDAVIMPQTGTVVYVKNGVTAMALPLNNVKAVDAFAIFIYNGTDYWISFKRKDCQMLDGTGNVTKPIDKSQESFYLKKNFRPTLPPEFAAEVFRWDKSIRIQGDPAVLPRADIEKTTVMPRQHARFFLYFRKRSINYSSLRIIVPRVTSDFNDQQTTFVFKFKVQRG